MVAGIGDVQVAGAVDQQPATGPWKRAAVASPPSPLKLPAPLPDPATVVMMRAPSLLAPITSMTTFFRTTVVGGRISLA